MSYSRAFIEQLESRTLLSGYALENPLVHAEPLWHETRLRVPLAQQSHVTDSDAEALAKVVAYQDWTVGASVNAGPGFLVSRVFNRPSDGFYAIGLTSQTESPVLVLRGTNDPADIRSEVNPRGAGFNQFADNYSGKKGVKAWLDSMTAGGTTVDIVGHSLGGALAQWIAAQYTHKNGHVGRVVTFNSPGVSASYAKLFNPALASDVTHYITSGDVVSMAGQVFIAGQYRLAHFSSANLLPAGASLLDIYQWELAKHTSHVLTSDGGPPPADVTIDAPRPTLELNSRLFVFTDPEFSDMRQALPAALSGTPGLGKQYRSLPAALSARFSTEANRGRIFKLILGAFIL
jgi:pimeloyl-ACP methyl ester carboxylesterase